MGRQRLFLTTQNALHFPNRKLQTGKQEARAARAGECGRDKRSLCASPLTVREVTPCGPPCSCPSAFSFPVGVSLSHQDQEVDYEQEDED